MLKKCYFYTRKTSLLIIENYDIYKINIKLPIIVGNKLKKQLILSVFILNCTEKESMHISAFPFKLK